jgi:shikimate dehydrogenase
MPDRYAVIGNPVAHSKSPRIHALFARETGEDIVYGTLSAAPHEFEAVVARFSEEGGRGLNVTLPFKHRAYVLAQLRSARAKQAQAVNTLSLGNEIAGDNTDGAGLVRDLRHNLGCELGGRRILLMGAGGAAYGVCGPLLEENPAALVVANRTPAKADKLCTHFRSTMAGTQPLQAAGYADLRGLTFDVVINATSAGLSAAMPPLPAGLFSRGAWAYDMVYGRSTPFLDFAKAEGAHSADGLGMLVEQAAESFHVWRGKRPQTASVIELLRRET